MRHALSLGTSRNAERGVTLVELMVSIAIGLFIVLVATTIYVQGLSTVSFRAGQSENLNNTRYVLDVLDNELTKTGYRRDPLQLIEEAFPEDATANAQNQCQFAKGQAIYAPDAKSLCIRYQARDESETDCGGTAATLGAASGPYVSPVAGTGVFSERYHVENGSLVCQPGGDKATAQKVADGVRDVHFEFGVDKLANPGLGRHVDEYTTTAPTGAEVIRSLRYTILLSSTAKGLTQGMDSTVCTRWIDAGGDEKSCDTSKGQLYQLATGSLTLRNLMP